MTFYNTAFLFGKKDDILSLEKSELKNYKKIGTKELQDGTVYLLYVHKKKKFPEAKRLLFYLVDMGERKLYNLVAEGKKDYYFIRSTETHSIVFGKEDMLRFELVLSEEKKAFTEPLEDSIEEYADNYLGVESSYHFVKESYKELVASYEKPTNPMLVMAFLSMMVGIGGFFYYDMNKPQEKVIPRRPHITPLTVRENNFLKKELTQRYINSLYKKAEEIQKSKDNLNNIDVKRLIGGEFSSIKERKAQDPYYDERSNRWLWGDEKMKRGSFYITPSATFQKVYPDIGYHYTRTLNGVKLYKKREESKDEIFGTEYSDKMAKKGEVLSQWCIDSIVRFPNTKVVTRNDEEITILFNKIPAMQGIKGLLEVYKHCPIYLDSFTLSSGEINGQLVAFKGEEDEKAKK